MENVIWETGLLGLFISAFVSSTLAPGSSEAVLAYLVLNTDISYYWLGATATLGNTLGAITTLLLGYLPSARLSKRFAKKFHDPKAIELLRKWGLLALLFSWLPIIGDGLCFAAGLLRLSLTWSIIFIAVGKAARYAALIYILV